MSDLASILQTPLAQALGWTLAHFLWEGAVLAAILLAALSVLRASPARTRYAAACLVLAAMPLAFFATLAVMWLRQPMPIHRFSLSASVLRLPVDAVPMPPATRWTLAAILDRLAWLVPFWLAGVAYFYVRGLAGWAAAQRLRGRGVCAAVPAWQARLDSLASQIGISRPVALLESCFADVPVLVGYLRPAILLPVGCLTGLSAAQVECILLHELMHVLRRDYLVNLLQSAVEGLLFYHPAVWWTSRVLRAERENCCDDGVVEVVGDARSYAATLAVLEERRALAPQAALAATGGNLMKRILRLTQSPAAVPASSVPAASATLLLVLFAAGLAALPARLPVAGQRRSPVKSFGVAWWTAAAVPPAPQQKGDPGLASPYEKWLLEDVVYIVTNAERDAFHRLGSDSEREQFIEQFWKRRDPTSGTEENEYKEEHYRRIAFANQHFTAGIAGWKTDRGRIYIMYGPPDEIDDHSRPEDQGAATYPFQAWRYRYLEGIGQNVIVEFVDRDGTGEFRMTMDPTAKDREPAPARPAMAVAGKPDQPHGYAIGPEEKAAFLMPHSAAQPSSSQLPLRYRQWLNDDARYIITGEERAAFLRLQSDAEREEFITQFWRRRDPRPDTAVNEFKEEHYRRIQYANDHFSSGIPGSKTDRGMMYIRFGPPDTIATAGSSIVWTYRRIEGIGDDVKVEFVDPTGAGEYHMTLDPAEKDKLPAAQFVRDERVFELDQAIAAKKSDLERLRGRYTDSYPAVLSLQDEIRALKQQRAALGQ